MFVWSPFLVCFVLCISFSSNKCHTKLYLTELTNLCVAVFYACLELSSFNRSFKDKLTISSQMLLVLYNIIFQVNNIWSFSFSWLCYKICKAFL